MALSNRDRIGKMFELLAPVPALGSVEEWATAMGTEMETAAAVAAAEARAQVGGHHGADHHQPDDHRDQQLDEGETTLTTHHHSPTRK